MAEREVKIGLATYRRADGPDDSPVWGFGLFGGKVDVHEDDLGRFDRLNGPAASELPPLPEALVADESAEPPRSGRGSGVEAWTEYAEGLGLLVPEDASRDEVIALVDDSK